MATIFLDVDGPLNPTSPGHGYLTYVTRPDTRWWDGKSRLLVNLNRAHGTWLRLLAEATGATLEWASGWEHAANDWISPVLELPALPWVTIPDYDRRIPFGAWKAHQVAAYATEPFVWFEDEGRSALPVLRKRARVPFKVIHVSPVWGLSYADIRRARNWLKTLA